MTINFLLPLSTYFLQCFSTVNLWSYFQISWYFNVIIILIIIYFSRHHYLISILETKSSRVDKVKFFGTQPLKIRTYHITIIKKKKKHLTQILLEPFSKNCALKLRKSARNHSLGTYTTFFQKQIIFTPWG